MDRAGSRSWRFPAGLILGCLGALALDDLPSPWVLGALAAGGLLALKPASTRALGAFLLALCWTLVNFQLRLEDRLDARLGGQVMSVCGAISSVPQHDQDYVSFRFEPNPQTVAGQPGERLPQTLLVRWYEEWPAVSAGQAWCLDLLLKPPWGPVNFQGPDRERWLFAEGIGAVASVRDGTFVAPAGANGQRLTMLRESLRRQIREDLPNVREAGIVAALAVADRSGISRADRQLLTLTGTSHLLAISGLHIGLAAVGGLLAARWLGWLLPLARRGRGLVVLGLGGGAVASPVVEIDAPLAGREGTIRVMGIDPFRAARLQPGFLAEGGASRAEGAPTILDANAAWLTPAALAQRIVKSLADGAKLHHSGECTPILGHLLAKIE